MYDLGADCGAVSVQLEFSSAETSCQVETMFMDN